MPHVSPSRLIGELTFLQIPNLLRKTSILCLPIGSIEQHGPHLPLNTDVVLAEALTKSIVARWGEILDLWQLPTISISLAREHEWAPGTLSLSVHGITALLRDLGREIARALPARNLAVVNGHGGNKGVLEAVAQDLRADFSLNVCILSPTGLARIRRECHDSGYSCGKNGNVNDAGGRPAIGAPRSHGSTEESARGRRRSQDDVPRRGHLAVDIER